MGLLNVQTSHSDERSECQALTSPVCWTEEHWYAAYTCANHEKSVATELRARGVEHFLPLYRSVRRWKDRRVSLDLPLFPGYIFVRLALCNRLRVLQIPSVARLLGFGGAITALPDEQMETLHAGLTSLRCAEPHPFLTAGRRVRIVRGPLAGFEGVLRRKTGNFYFVLSVDLIHRSIAVRVDAADVQPVAQTAIQT